MESGLWRKTRHPPNDPAIHKVKSVGAVEPDTGFHGCRTGRNEDKVLYGIDVGLCVPNAVDAVNRPAEFTVLLEVCLCPFLSTAAEIAIIVSKPSSILPTRNAACDVRSAIVPKSKGCFPFLPGPAHLEIRRPRPAPRAAADSVEHNSRQVVDLYRFRPTVGPIFRPTEYKAIPDRLNHRHACSYTRSMAAHTRLCPDP